MLTYLKLAELSHRKRHSLGSDKLLVLAGVEACLAGCLPVAERCRDVVVRHHPRHQLAKYASLAEALRGDDFPLLVKRLKKLCSHEQAEFLAREWGLSAESPDNPSSSDIEAAANGILDLL